MKEFLELFSEKPLNFDPFEEVRHDPGMSIEEERDV